MIFLRPYWLLLLFVPIVLMWTRRQTTALNPWQKYVDAVFLPYLTVVQKAGLSKTSLKLMCWFVWGGMTLALSGPAIDKWLTPTINQHPATVLIVDLNTLNPSKTTLMHVKLYDIIRQLKDNQIGLVLYDEKGYVALPLTQDTAVLNDMIPSLQVSVLPSVGNDVAEGFQKAIELLQNTHQKSGRILLITGGTPDISKALPLIQKTPYQIGVLGIQDGAVATPIVMKNGSFLRDTQGNLVLSHPNEGVLSQLGTYRSSTPTGQEIPALIQATQPSDKPFVLQSDSPFGAVQADVWRDLGVYIVVLVIPFLAYLFRKGIFFIILWGVLTVSVSARADLWQRPDQHAYHQMQQADEAYRRQDYQRALALYGQQTSQTALFNQGNALAHLGRYQEAIALYDKVLQQNPRHHDALFNKTYLEEQLKKQQPQQASNSNANKSDTSSDHTDNSNDSEGSNNSNEENRGADTPSSNSSDNSDRTDNNTNGTHQSDNTDNQTGQEQSSISSDMSDKQQNKQSDALTSQQQDKPVQPFLSDSSDKQDEQTNLPNELTQNTTDTPQTLSGASSEIMMSDVPDQETQQIINRLPRDPYRILRYRLYQQYQQDK